MNDKINIFLTSTQKIKFLILIFFFLIASLIEILSIGTVPLFVITLMQPEKMLSISQDFFFKELITSVNTDQFLFYGSIIILLVFTFKNIFLSFLVFFENMLSSNIRKSISSKLYQKYITQNYLFHTKNNPSLLIRNISHEVDFSVSYIDGLINLIREGLVIIAIVLLLLNISPVMTLLISSVLSFVVFIFYFLQEKRIKEKGVFGQILRAELIKLVNHTIGSIKDIKVLGKESYFSNKFIKMYADNEKYKIYKIIVSNLPQRIHEILIIFLLVGFVFFSKNLYSSVQEFLGILSLFVISAIRLYPSFSRINSNLIVVKDLSVSFNLICKELELHENLNTLSENIVNKKNLIESIVFNKVSFEISNKEIIKEVSFEIKKGQFVAIVGKSGSGKSTIIDLIMGLLLPTNGQITIDKDNINKKNMIPKQLFGYVPQDIYLLDDTIKKNIALGVSDNEIDMEKLNKAVELSQLDKFLQKDGNSLDTIVGNRGIKISGGELQRVGIARAIYNDPDVIILDEATANLDHKTALDFINSITELKKKKTIIFATHQPELIKNCDKVIFVENGQVQKN
jgi:ABC-type multidrug transport system fused ATPase/permease subunit